jgi:hypothetical protein
MLLEDFHEHTTKYDVSYGDVLGPAAGAEVARPLLPAGAANGVASGGYASGPFTAGGG